MGGTHVAPRRGNREAARVRLHAAVRSDGQAAGSSSATHSTWAVIGKASNAAQRGQPVARLRERRDVAGQGRGVAGDVDDRSRTGAGEQRADRPPGTGPGRVEHDDVRRRAQLVSSPASPSASTSPCQTSAWGRSARLASAAAHAPASDSTQTTRPSAPDRRRQRAAEEAGAGVEVQHGLPRPHGREARDGGDQRVRGRRVHLPEPGALDLPVAPARVPLGAAARLLGQLAARPHHAARRRHGRAGPGGSWSPRRWSRRTRRRHRRRASGAPSTAAPRSPR